jgi:hypothetical protein
MSDQEDELHRALRRPEVPEGFSARVLARVEASHPARLQWARRSAFRWAAAAAAGMLLLGGGVYARREQQRREGLEAKREVMLALSIASRELRVAQLKTQDIYRTGSPHRPRREQP